jgi:hypothetical protein
MQLREEEVLMLGRKDYTKEELKRAKEVVNEQLVSFEAVASSLGSSRSGSKAGKALDELEGVVFNNMVLALDRFFVHRLRSVTGKDGNPLNELEMLADSLMNNGGVLHNPFANVIKYVPEDSVLKLKIGDPIRLSATEFEQLANAVFADLKRKYVP